MPVGESRLVLLPSRDMYEAVEALETPEGQSIDSQGLIAWLKELEKTQPFEITTLSPDLVRARFTTEIQDPRGLMRRIEEICPDVADTTLKVARTRELYLWWD